MITFYCVHCGLHISAAPSYSGADSQCPSCNGVVKVPTLEVAPTKIVPVPAPTNNKKSFWKVDRKGVFTMVGISLLVFLIYGKSVSNDLAEESENIRRENLRESIRIAEKRNFDEKMDGLLEYIEPLQKYEPIEIDIPDLEPIKKLSKMDLPSIYTLFGLKLMLYGNPTKVAFNLPGSIKNDITFGEQYLSQGGDVYTQIFHYKSKEYVNVNGSVEGAILAVKNLKGVTDFKSSVENKYVGGVPSKLIDMTYTRSGYSIRHITLNIYQGRKVWGVSVAGDNNKPNVDSKFRTVINNVFTMNE